MPDRKLTIIIPEDETVEGVIEVVQEWLGRGMTSGYYPDWTLRNVTESTQVDPADERMIRDALDERVVRALEAGGLDLSDGVLDVIVNTDKLIRLVQSIAREEAGR